MNTDDIIDAFSWCLDNYAKIKTNTGVIKPKQYINKLTGQVMNYKKSFKYLHLD